MGHRALVAYERPDETYNLHYSHWGGCNLRLKHDLTKRTPLGGDEEHHPWTTAVYEHYQTAEATDLPDIENAERPSTAVEPEPWAVGLTIEEIITEYLDYLMHEAFYVVPQSFEVTAYRTLWPGFSSQAESVENSPSIGHGVLMTVRWHDGQPVGDGYLRGWFGGMKRILGEFIDRGVFTETQATSYLLEEVIARYRHQDEYYVKRQNR